MGITEELQVIIRQFSDETKRVQTAGGVGGRIHTAHAYGLLDGFLLSF